MAGPHLPAHQLQTGLVRLTSRTPALHALAAQRR